jgi:5-methylcytosine-specific restriction endonuclease McrA
MEIKYIPRPWEKKVNQGVRYAPDGWYQSKEWKQIRAAYLAANPFCECDEHKGKKVKAEMVDHIKPIKQGGSRTDWANLQALTNKCHFAKSARDKNELYKNHGK